MAKKKEKNIKLDLLDRKILAILQQDTTRSLDDIAAQLGSSRSPVWGRIRRLTRLGVITKQVALVDPGAIGLDSVFFINIRTSRHDTEWLEAFQKMIMSTPQIVEAHRLAGEIDYLLKVRVADAHAFDEFYRQMIGKVSIFNVTSMMSMQQIKYETALPIPEDA